MPSSVVYATSSGSISNVALPSSSAQVLMGWIKRTTSGISQENGFAFGFSINNTFTENVGNWGVALGESSGNHYTRLTAAAWLAVTQSVISSTDWYFAVLQRPSASSTVNVRLFRDNGPTFTKDADITVGGSSEIRTANRIVVLGKDGSYQYTGIRYFTGSTFTDDQCREQATYRFPSTHPTASLYDYWILETATQLTGSVTGTILSGSIPILSASSAPVSIRPARRLRYVNTNSTAGGDGTTNATAGANRAYESLFSLTSAMPDTLVTTDQYLEIQCTGTVPDINVSQRGVTFTSNAHNYVLLTAAPGQEARIPMDRTRYVYSGSLALGSNIIMRNLQLDYSGSGAGLGTNNTFAPSRSFQIIGNTVYQRGSGYGMQIAPAPSASVYLINNFVSASSGAAAGMLTQTSEGPGITIVAYNNTSVGGVRSFFNTYYGANDTFIFKNNLGFSGSTSCFYQESTPSTSIIENNASSDASAYANTVGGATLRNRPFRFANENVGNYKLADNDTGAIRTGVDLSSDPYYSFNTDFDGYPRRIGLWDIGADQNNKQLGLFNRAARFTDDFNRADGNIGNEYDTMVTGSGLPLTIVSNAAGGPSVPLNLEVLFSSVKTGSVQFSPNQEAQVTFTQVGNFDFAGPAVRVNPINGTAYYLKLDGRSTVGRLFKLNAGVEAQISAASVPVSVGDTVKLRVVGTTFSVYKNGILIETVTDSSYSTGQPGLFYKRENAGATRMDNFVAQDVSSGNIVVMTPSGVGKLTIGVI